MRTGKEDAVVDQLNTIHNTDCVDYSGVDYKGFSPVDTVNNSPASGVTNKGIT